MIKKYIENLIQIKKEHKVEHKTSKIKFALMLLICIFLASSRNYVISYSATKSKHIINNPPEYYKGRLLFSIEKASVIAIDDIGISYKNATVLRRDFAYELGSVVYHILILDDKTNIQYLYNIDAMDGRIISSDERHLNQNNEYEIVSVKNHNFDESIVSQVKVIPIEEIAKNILQIVPGSTRDELWIYEVEEMDRKYYKGELLHNYIMTEFKIDPSDGLVIEWKESEMKEVGVFKPELKIETYQLDNGEEISVDEIKK